MRCQSVEIDANPLGVGEIEHKGSVKKMALSVKLLSLLRSTCFPYQSGHHFALVSSIFASKDLPTSAEIMGSLNQVKDKGKDIVARAEHLAKCLHEPCQGDQVGVLLFQMADGSSAS